MNTLEYLINLVVYEFLLMLILSPILLAAIGIMEGIKLLELGAIAGVARVLLFLVVIVVLLGMPYVAHKAAGNRVLANMSFMSALRSAWVDTRVELQFLPIIGQWLSGLLGARDDRGEDF